MNALLRWKCVFIKLCPMNDCTYLEVVGEEEGEGVPPVGGEEEEALLLGGGEEVGVEEEEEDRQLPVQEQEQLQLQLLAMRSLPSVLPLEGWKQENQVS